MESIKNIELRQSQPVDAAGADSLPHQHRIEPAATPRPPGHGSKLAAAVSDGPSDLVVLLGWERTRSDPSRIGFADSKHIANCGRTEARSGRRLGGNRIG